MASRMSINLLHAACASSKIKKNKHDENYDNSEMAKSRTTQLKDTALLSGTAIEDLLNCALSHIARNMSNN